jgi:hypothetical protein
MGRERLRVDTPAERENKKDKHTTLDHIPFISFCFCIQEDLGICRELAFPVKGQRIADCATLELDRVDTTFEL